MKTLHQELAELRERIAKDEALVAQGKHLWETHQAQEGLPRRRDLARRIETDIELLDAALHHFASGLHLLQTISAGGRELSLAITHAEDAEIRTRRHLGSAEVKAES